MNDLVAQYKAKIEPLFPLAKKAYGSRSQNTPAHKASQEYTRLLVEFYNQKGSLPELARALGVAYPGIRRRVVMHSIFISESKPRRKANKSELPAAIERVKIARQSKDVISYHNQLAQEYKNGFSLQDIAKGIGLGSAAPLYYGVQRSLQKGE